MRKFFKIFLYSILGLFLLAAIGIGVFMYKVKNGFPIYETEAPALPEDLNGFSVLVFSKTNGFRHGESIEAALPAFEEMARQNDWKMFQSDNGALFAPEHLEKFDVVVWNNVSGKVLTPEQRNAFKNYIESGGGFVALHAAGDASHHWDWYEDQLIGARFSHHSLNPHFQEGNMYLETDTTETQLREALPTSWTHSEEWYVFSSNPRQNGKQVLYTLDETGLKLSGNLGFLVSDKDFGMGEDHPIIWYGEVGQGKSAYSALGHSAESFLDPTHLQVLQNAILWAGN